MDASPHPPAAVLLVEDDATVRICTADALEDYGFAVFQACTVGEGLAALRANPTVAVVICDIRLPDGDGRTMASDMRAERPQVRFVLISGDARAGRGVPPQVATFLEKPLSADALCLAVRGLIEEQARQAALP